MTTLDLIRWAIALAGVAALVVAALFIVIPRASWDARSRLRRVLVEADLATIFDRRFTIERRIYRRHRLFGALVVVGALSALGLMVAIGTRQPIVVSAVAALGSTGVAVMVASGALTVTLILAAGIVLILRPSALKGIESRANRWIDPLSGSPSSASVARVVTGSPRIMGALLLLAGVVCLMNA
jgi:hypothetical protein